jgi:hypothetical protein
MPIRTLTRLLFTPLIVCVFVIADVRAFTCTQLQDGCTVYEGSTLFVDHLRITKLPSSLHTVNSKLQFSGPIASLEILSNLQHIHDLAVASLGEDNLEGLRNIRTLGSFSCQGLPSNLEGLRSLVEVEADLNLSSCARNVENYDGLRNLQKVGGTFELRHPCTENTCKRADLSGFKSLAEVGSLYLGANNKIQPNVFPKLRSVRYLGVGTSVGILPAQDTSNVIISGFNSLETIQSQFIVSKFTSADSSVSVIEGFEKVESIGDLGSTLSSSSAHGILIDGRQLRSLRGFSALKEVRGPVRIKDTQLEKLEIFSRVKQMDSLSIRYNRQLSNCISLIPFLEARGYPDSGDGYGIDIEGNGPGCASVQEIFDKNEWLQQDHPEAMFLRLLDTVNTATDSASSESREATGEARKASQQQGMDAQAEPSPVSSLSSIGLLILSGLVGFLAIRRLAHQ